MVRRALGLARVAAPAVEGVVLGSASGRAKKEAEQEAARFALERLAASEPHDRQSRS
jgi:dsRNA-specific ribonuclease